MAATAPKLDTYRVNAPAARPTVSFLRMPLQLRSLGALFSGGGANADTDTTPSKPGEPTSSSASSSQKFGMWDGVFARCLLNIFGVMLFLRLGWVTGYAGVGLSVAVILVAVSLTTITTLSLSAICTNGAVEGGGAYYLISRSLGPEFGGAIGGMFFIANAVAVAMYLVGFAETIVGQLGDTHIVSESWDLQVVATGALIFITVLCLIGVSWVIKFQLGLLALLVVAILSFVIGCFQRVTDDTPDAFLGLNSARNLEPSWCGDCDDFPAGAKELESEYGSVNFGVALSVFFPAVTGIMAGANISGDLKDASAAIPRGTLLAILVSTAVYVILAVLFGLVAARTVVKSDGEFGGLLHDSLLMAEIAIFPPLVYAGIYAATLSSGIASLVGAPRILQAIAKDNLFPILRPFAKGSGAGNEPYRGYALSFVIAQGCILVGDLNFIAPLITNFFMAAYSLTNFACFLADYSRSPGWRPTFTSYNRWVSLFGTIACFAFMLYLDLIMGGITVFIGAVLYKYVEKKQSKGGVNWGSAKEGQRYLEALHTVSKLQKTSFHVKNWRPQFLFLTGGSMADWQTKAGLLALSRHMSKGKGISIYGQVVVTDFDAYMAAHRHSTLAPGVNHSSLDSMKKQLLHELAMTETPGFVNSVIAPSKRLGVQSLLQIGGLGQLRANTVMMSMKSRWTTASEEDRQEYVSIIGDCFDLGCGVGVVVGLDAYQRLYSEKNDCSDTAYIDDVVAARAQLVATRGMRAASVESEDMAGMMEEKPSGASAKPSEVAIRIHDAAGPSGASVTSTSTVTVPSSAALVDAGPGFAPSPPSALFSSYQRAHSISSQSTDTTTAATVRSDSLRTCIAADIEAGLPPDLLGAFGEQTQTEAEGRTAAEKHKMCCGSSSTAREPERHIDVWWHEDDGGLSVLLPHLLHLHKRWRDATMRIMVTGAENVALAAERQRVETMMSKFRIPCVVVAVLEDSLAAPSSEVLRAYVAASHEAEPISSESLRYLRLGDLIVRHSNTAAIVFATLPVPRVGQSPRQYLAWLHAMSQLAGDDYGENNPAGDPSPFYPNMDSASSAMAVTMAMPSSAAATSHESAAGTGYGSPASTAPRRHDVEAGERKTATDSQLEGEGACDAESQQGGGSLRQESAPPTGGSPPRHAATAHHLNPTWPGKASAAAAQGGGRADSRSRSHSHKPLVGSMLMSSMSKRFKQSNVPVVLLRGNQESILTFNS